MTAQVVSVQSGEPQNRFLRCCRLNKRLVERTEHHPPSTAMRIADLHVETLASSSPVDVISTDRQMVKPWFQGKIPFAFNLPELQNSEFSLLAGRMTYRWPVGISTATGLSSFTANSDPPV